MEEKFKKYGKSMDGNFEVVDSIGVPHPYCVGPKHLKYSSSMYLDIPEAEAKGAVCCICKRINFRTGKPILSYDEHEQALLVACYADDKDDDMKHELHEYLLSIKEMTEKDGYAGYAFMDKFSKGGKND